MIPSGQCCGMFRVLTVPEVAPVQVAVAVGIPKRSLLTLHNRVDFFQEPGRR